jgi:uncharacterized protein YceK
MGPTVRASLLVPVYGPVRRRWIISRIVTVTAKTTSKNCNYIWERRTWFGHMGSSVGTQYWLQSNSNKHFRYWSSCQAWRPGVVTEVTLSGCSSFLLATVAQRQSPSRNPVQKNRSVTSDPANWGGWMLSPLQTPFSQHVSTLPASIEKNVVRFAVYRHTRITVDSEHFCQYLKVITSCWIPVLWLYSVIF